MVYVVYIDPDGVSHRTLPSRWKNVSPVTEAWALSHGWTKEQRTVPDPPEVHTYSKLRIYDVLVEMGLWETIKSEIELAGQWERWNMANDLSTAYAPFAAMLAELRTKMGDELVDQVLEQAEI